MVGKRKCKLRHVRINRTTSTCALRFAIVHFTSVTKIGLSSLKISSLSAGVFVGRWKVYFRRRVATPKHNFQTHCTTLEKTSIGWISRVAGENNGPVSSVYYAVSKLKKHLESRENFSRPKKYIVVNARSGSSLSKTDVVNKTKSFHSREYDKIKSIGTNSGDRIRDFSNVSRCRCIHDGLKFFRHFLRHRRRYFAYYFPWYYRFRALYEYDKNQINSPHPTTRTRRITFTLSSP